MCLALRVLLNHVIEMIRKRAYPAMKTTETPDIEIKVIRQRRKSIVGKVLTDGNIEVRAPLTMTTAEINSWLDKYEHKFMPMVKRCREIYEYQTNNPLTYGSELLFLGKRINIIPAKDDNDGYMAVYKDGSLIMKPGMPEADMRRWIAWKFTDLAKPVFEKKLYDYTSLMGVKFSSWTIGVARKRHGSCSSNGKITLSWLIIMMDEPVIDYIIVHELMHLKQFDHSKTFHDKLAEVLPDWKERRKAHINYCLILRCEGWI